MSEILKNYINENSKDLIDKTVDKQFFYSKLIGTISNYNSNIDKLTNLSQLKKDELKNDIKLFLLLSLKNNLYSPAKLDGNNRNAFGEYNIASSDINREKGLDAFEFSKYIKNLEEAFKLIIELGGIKKFKGEMGKIYEEANNSYTMNMDLFGDKNEKNPITTKYRDFYLKTVQNLNHDEIEELVNTQFKGDKDKFIKGLCICIGTELGVEVVETIVNFVYDLGKGILQLPEFMYFNLRYNLAKTQIDKKEYQVKMKSRLDDNMALGLLALANDLLNDVTINELGFGVSPDVSTDYKGSRFKELVHRIGKPNTWTPNGIKETVIAFLPLLRKTTKNVGTKSASVVGETKIVDPAKPKVINSAKQQITSKPPEPKQIKNTPLKSVTKEGVPVVIENNLIKVVNNGEILLNDQSIDLNRKLSNPKENFVKARMINNEIVKFDPEVYIKSSLEALYKLGNVMKDFKNWAIMSSGAMYLQNPEYKTLFDDLDVIITDIDFKNISELLRKKFEKGEIQNFKVTSIDKSIKDDIRDVELIEKLMKAGNLKIEFTINTKNGIAIDVEMFPNGKGRGFIQLGTIPRTIGVHTIGGVEIRSCSLSDLKDVYTLVLLDEFSRNSVLVGGKAKDANRIYNLTYYLKDVGIHSPRDLLVAVDEVVEKYKDYGGDELTEGIKVILNKAPELKNNLEGVIDKYEIAQINSDKLQINRDLPRFQEFVEEWNEKKTILKKIYDEIQNIEKIDPIRKKEIIKTLKGHEREMEYIMKNSLNNDDFAYFYEMSMINNRYIKEINKYLK